MYECSMFVFGQINQSCRRHPTGFRQHRRGSTCRELAEDKIVAARRNQWGCLLTLLLSLCSRLCSLLALFTALFTACFIHGFVRCYLCLQLCSRLSLSTALFTAISVYSFVHCFLFSELQITALSIHCFFCSLLPSLISYLPQPTSVIGCAVMCPALNVQYLTVV